MVKNKTQHNHQIATKNKGKTASAKKNAKQQSKINNDNVNIKGIVDQSTKQSDITISIHLSHNETVKDQKGEVIQKASELTSSINIPTTYAYGSGLATVAIGILVFLHFKKLLTNN